MKTIVLVGIPGSGKSSIIRETLLHVPALAVVNYGDKMLEEAASEGITRDMLRKMSFREQQQIGIEAAKTIMQETIGEIALIDTHALIRTPIGFVPGLPHEVLQILSPSACAWIECLPSLILQRRAGDSARKRDVETEEELALHQDLTRSFMTACCMASGSLLCRIPNNSLAISENARPLVRLIKSLVPSAALSHL